MSRTESSEEAQQWTRHSRCRRDPVRSRGDGDAALLGNLAVARQQRTTTERQLSHAAEERLGTERRAAFVDYLAAYSDLREKIAVLAPRSARDQIPDEPPLAAGSASKRRRAARFEDYAAEEIARFCRSYHTLRITGDDAVSESAERCTAALWALADLAATGDPDEYEDGWQTAKTTRRALRKAMRAELGIARPDAQR